MKLGHPIKNFKLALYPEGSVTQWFAESPELYQKICIAGGPCHKSMVCPKGTGCLIGHNGIDIVAPWGTPILAVAAGKVTDCKNNPGGYGKHVRIFDGKYEHTYGHLSEIRVDVGEEVVMGQEIGLMGNTGFVVSGATPFWKHNPYAGTHLHYGIREMKRVSVVNYENGYFGSFDPRPFFEETEVFIKQALTTISLINQLLLLLKNRR